MDRYPHRHRLAHEYVIRLWMWLWAVFIIGCVALLLSGCALEPKSIRLGAEHISSISQHFGADSTNVAVELATLSAHWTPTRNTYLEIQDGYIVNDIRFAGHREVFEARTGYEITLK